MKFILKIVIGFVLFFGLSAWLLTMYLAPNDLKSCDVSPSSIVGCQKVDAIVAVSGGDTLARTDEAIKLYQNGWANLLIFSGAAADKAGPSNAEVMSDRALEAGVPESAIVTEEASETTSENAKETSNIFKSHDIHTVILVTSSYHERRASMEFRRNNPDVKVLSHPVANDNQWSKIWWLTPVGWWLALSELFKTIVVALGGVIR